MADDRHEAYCRMYNLDAIEELVKQLKHKLSTTEIIYAFYERMNAHPDENLYGIIKLIQTDYGII
jgi:hypothetical protein